MRSAMWIFGLTLAVLATPAVAQTAVGVSADIPFEFVVANPQGGGQFSGAFVFHTQFSPGQVSTAFLALHVDRTVTQTSNNAVFSSIHGVWEKTGPKTIRITEFTFISDSTGAFWGIGRSRLAAEFSKEFNSFSGMAFNEGTPCLTRLTCPDPLDPSTTWYPEPGMPPTGYPISGTRTEALPVSPLP